MVNFVLHLVYLQMLILTGFKSCGLIIKNYTLVLRFKYGFYPILRDDLLNANFICSTVIICMLHVSAELDMIVLYPFGLRIKQKVILNW